MSDVACSWLVDCGWDSRPDDARWLTPEMPRAAQPPERQSDHERWASEPRSRVEQGLLRFLECGIPAHGFVRVRCVGWGHERLVPFSCKGRGSCPSCGGRRMAESAAHLIDRVPPAAPVRQSLLPQSFSLRFAPAGDHVVLTGVLRVVMRAVLGIQRARAWRLGVIGQCCAVTAMQRFGGELNLNLHFHAVVLDGVHVMEVEGRLRFQALPPPTAEPRREWMRERAGDREACPVGKGAGGTVRAALRAVPGARPRRRSRPRAAPHPSNPRSPALSPSPGHRGRTRRQPDARQDRRTTAGSVTVAMIFVREPQRGHFRTTTPNTRRSSCPTTQGQAAMGAGNGRRKESMPNTLWTVPQRPAAR